MKFEIVHANETQLMIAKPPVYWVAGFLVVVGLIGLLMVGGYVIARVGPKVSVVNRGDGKTYSSAELGRGWGVPAAGVLLMLVGGYGAWCTLQPSRVVLDRRAGQYTVDLGRPFLMHLESAGELRQIRYATVETDTGGDRFVLVLQDGKRIGLGAFTDQGGQSEAAEAVNTFLGVSAQR